MQVIQHIKEQAVKAIGALYNLDIPVEQVTLNETKPEFTGDYTLVLFAWVKTLRKGPDALGQEIGNWLVANNPDLFTGFNLIKGFLNLEITPGYWLHFLQNNNESQYGFQPDNGRKVMVEYSSPNTNKPLHLGHLRNNFLGWSVAEIYAANGWRVQRTCIVNDRGVHICKSMLAWQKYGNGATPASTGTKGDHLVGDYYVMFENELKLQAEPIYQQLLAGEIPELIIGEAAEKATTLQKNLGDANLLADKQAELKAALKELARYAAPIMVEVREMLLKWEQGDAETLALWRTMNSWVYAGFDTTYKRIGSHFDTIYYESEIYLLGREMVDKGLQEGIFFKKPDGSVWIDLTADGLDEKLVLRKDGTSVYITQDIGLAQRKYEAFAMEQSLYVIADEQNYHMKVLQLICQKLGMPFAPGIQHLSYGMVDLPTGRMKSREGTVVDADDLCDEMEQVAAQKTEELGKVKDFSAEALQQLYHTLGMGALKFYLLRVDPKKRLVFNPEESIDFQGFTGPFVQYSYARIQSVLRKLGADNDAQMTFDLTGLELAKLEKSLLVNLEQFPWVLQQAMNELSPATVANYAYNVARAFNSFYTVHSVANAENDALKQFRISLCRLTGYTIKNAMQLLGIAVPERM